MRDFGVEGIEREKMRTRGVRGEQAGEVAVAVGGAESDAAEGVMLGQALRAHATCVHVICSRMPSKAGSTLSGRILRKAS